MLLATRDEESGTVVIHFSYEELTAVKAGATLALQKAGGGGVRVAAPPEIIADVETVMGMLDGELGVSTLADQLRLERAFGYIADHLRERMHATLLEGYVGAEDAVVAYFDYAYVFSVHDRVRQMGDEMRAMLEMMTGRPPDERAEQEIVFPD